MNINRGADLPSYITMLPEVLGEITGSVKSASNELNYREFKSKDILVYFDKILSQATEKHPEISPDVVIISTETAEITPEFTSSVRWSISKMFSEHTAIMGINLGNSSNSSLAIDHAIDRIKTNCSTGILCVLFDCFHHRSSRLLSGGLAALSDGGCSFYISNKPLSEHSFRVASCTNVLHPSGSSDSTNNSIEHFQTMTSKVKSSLSNNVDNVVLNNYSKMFNEYFAKKIGIGVNALIYAEDYGHVSSSDTIINTRHVAEQFQNLTLVINSANMTGVVELVKN